MRLLLPALLAAGFLTSATAAPIRSVEQLDLSRYAGVWHEVAHLPMFFQRQCIGNITATYTLRDDGLIGVRNACKTKNGQMDTAEGVARRVESHPGQLEVRFAPDFLSWLPLVWADYWVVDLDPNYQWVVVGEPRRKYLWVLSRSPGMDRDLFDRIKQRAESMGYDLRSLIVSAPIQ